MRGSLSTFPLVVLGVPHNDGMTDLAAVYRFS